MNKKGLTNLFAKSRFECIIHYSISYSTDILVTTGHLSNGEPTASTELIMFDKGNCKHKPKIDSFPILSDFATGSLVNDSIIICGGKSGLKILNECHSLRSRSS